jgi:Flp pilus assembly protein TadD
MASDDLAEARLALAADDLARAERLLRRVLAREPGNSRAHELMAFAAARSGRDDRAVEHLRRATSGQSPSAVAWYELACILRRRGDLDSARTALRQACARDRRFFPAFHDLGVLLHEQGAAEEAIEALDRAAEISPDSFAAHHNRGRTLHALGRYEEALSSYDRALALKADHPATYLNRGEAYCSLRRYDDALADYRWATQISPSYDDARWNESLIRLLRGEYEQGWPLYESRWSGSMAWPRRHHDIPAWDCQTDVNGKRVLVWWEQGLGDTLHFCRYVPMLAARGARVVFEVQQPLVALSRSLAGGIEVIGDGEHRGACDLQVPLLTLPLAFGTTTGNVPHDVPYLRADEDLAREWAALFRPGRKIGVACSGHAAQKDDRQRSIALRELAPLARMAELYLVQVEVKGADREFAEAPGSHMHLLDERIRDFSDSAAIISAMDAIVTIDTSVAHLAGALAKPTWIMLPWTPTWRWMADREDSPWYPTARLVRQQHRGRWDDVVSRVCDALAR